MSGHFVILAQMLLFSFLVTLYDIFLLELSVSRY